MERLWRREHPLPVSAFHPCSTPTPLKKKEETAPLRLSGWPFLLYPIVGSCVPALHIPETYSTQSPSHPHIASSSWKTDLLKNVVFSSFLFSLNGWLVMCPVLLPVSMVPLDDNLAGETTIFNQTLIYCAAPLLAWLWLKEWVGCCVAFCSMFCWGVWLTLIGCSCSSSSERLPVRLSLETIKKYISWHTHVY